MTRDAHAAPADGALEDDAAGRRAGGDASPARAIVVLRFLSAFVFVQEVDASPRAGAAPAARGDVLQHAVAVHVRVRVEGRQEHLAHSPPPEKVHHLDALLLVRDEDVRAPERVFVAGFEVAVVVKKRPFDGRGRLGLFVMLKPRQNERRVLPPRPPVRRRERNDALAKLAARRFAEVPPLVRHARGGVELVVVLRDERVRETAHVPVEIVALVRPPNLPGARLERVVVEVPSEKFFFRVRRRLRRRRTSTRVATRARPHGSLAFELGVQRVERPEHVRLLVDHAPLDPAADDHSPAVALEHGGGGDQNRRLARLGVPREIPPERAFPHHSQVVVETHHVPSFGDHDDDPFSRTFSRVRRRRATEIFFGRDGRRSVFERRGSHGADAERDRRATPERDSRTFPFVGFLSLLVGVGVGVGVGNISTRCRKEARPRQHARALERVRGPEERGAAAARLAREDILRGARIRIRFRAPARSITSRVPSDILPGHLHHPQLRLVAARAAPRRDQHLAHAVAVQVEEPRRRRVVVARARVSRVGRIVDVGAPIEAPSEPRGVPGGFARACVARHHERGVEAHDTLAQRAVVHREARQEQREDVALGEHRGDAFSLAPRSSASSLSAAFATTGRAA